MERRFQRLCTVLGLAVALTMMLTFAPPVSSPGVRADLGPAPPTPANGKAVTTGAALHNAGLDNNDWYEFDLSPNYGLLANTTYAIIWQAPSSDYNNRFYFKIDDNGAKVKKNFLPSWLSLVIL